MSPRVSVIMPVFNGERFIGEAIRSVLANRFAEYELLLIDDGSTDGSVAEARQTAGNDPRLRVVEAAHGGVAAARNVGLAEARGEYIANLDSDDVMFPERLALQVAFLDRHADCVAVGGRSLIMDIEGRPLHITGRFWGHEAIDESLLRGNGGALGNDTAMFRRSAALEIGGYESHLQSTGEDHDFWLRLGERGRLANLPQVVNRYRVHDRNASAGDGSRERRLPVTLATLGRAFERRGITNRTPTKISEPPLRLWERWCDRALCRYFAGRRISAVGWITAASILNPVAPAVGAARHTIRARGTG